MRSARTLHTRPLATRMRDVAENELTRARALVSPCLDRLGTSPASVCAHRELYSL